MHDVLLKFDAAGWTHCPRIAVHGSRFILRTDLGALTLATVLIDKLLQAAIKQGVSDIHIVVGQPPGVPASRPDAQAGDQDAGRRGRGGVDEEHHAGALSA